MSSRRGRTLLTLTHDPYGDVYTADGAAATSFGFTGEQVDANGLLFLRARYYAPGMGRFLSADPARLEANPYGYASGSPVMHVDPSGLSGVLPPCYGPDWWCRTLTALGMVAPPPPAAPTGPWSPVQTYPATPGDGAWLQPRSYPSWPQVPVPVTPASPPAFSGTQAFCGLGLAVVFEFLVMANADYYHGIATSNTYEYFHQGNWQAAIETGTNVKDEILLYHYTFAENIASILAEGLRASLTENGDAMEGDGQYFTDLTPVESSTVTRQQHSAALFVSPWKWGGGGYVKQVGWIEVSLSVGQVIKAHPLFGQRFPHRSIYLYPNRRTLPLGGLVLNTGIVTFQPGPAGYQ